MIGKVPPETLSELILERTGSADDRVRQGGGYGEDAAAIELGEETLVVSTDPISMAVEHLGTLGVDVACNDVAASGGEPEWLTSTLFLPDDSEETLATITDGIHEAADALGVTVVGGHSEYAPDRETPLVVCTCIGTTDRFVPTGGAEAGDAIVLTGGAGIEGTAILATDFREELAEEVPAELLDRAGTFYDDVSVIEAARILRDSATAMHDPTEGGVLDGLIELASASKVRLNVDPGAIPIREETTAVCEAIGVDPLRIFGSGALIATMAPEEAEAAVAELREEEITAAVVGQVEAVDEAGDDATDKPAAEPALGLGEEEYREPVRDDMYELWEE